MPRGREKTCLAFMRHRFLAWSRLVRRRSGDQQGCVRRGRAESESSLTASRFVAVPRQTSGVGIVVPAPHAITRTMPWS
jgi:hypothetical protein